MASLSNVVVLTPHGRRMNIKLMPNTTLMKVLEDVCKKYGEFCIEDYDLKHHNKVLDLNIMVRYSGLPNNATLEMCAAAKKRVESSVVILVQLENGSRMTGSFSPSDTVWQVVSTLCHEELSTMSNPVVIYTRLELAGEEKMNATSLRSLGLTGGRAMLRLLNRTEEQLHQQANVSVTIPKQPRAPSPPPAPKPPVSDTRVAAEPGAEPGASSVLAEPPLPTSQVDTEPSTPPTLGSIDCLSPPRKIKRQESPVPSTSKDVQSKVTEQLKLSEAEAADKEVEKELVLLGERNAVVFNRLIQDPRLTPEDDLPKDFFELTIEDAKRIMRDLQRKKAELEDQPIKTAAMRDLEENRNKLALLQKYKHTVLRISFLDGTVLQAAFRPVESGEAVYNFVRSYLRLPDHAFELYTAPPKRVLQAEDRLIEIGCVPAAVLHFSAPSCEAPFLQLQLLDQMSSPAAALLAARRSKTT